jgi:glutaredoxin
MSQSVRVYTAAGCHLCDAALDVVAKVREEIPFGLEVVDISRDAELEMVYRERIPVVEVDGRPAFSFFVTAEGLREWLGRT